MIDVWRHKWHLNIVTLTKDLLFVGAQNIIELIKIRDPQDAFFLSFLCS